MKTDINAEIGQNLRRRRKAQGLSLSRLAEAVHKSPATISKYESGQITMDVQTLYDVARALGTGPDQLLYYPPMEEVTGTVPAFFQGLRQFFLYYYDGRNDSLVRCVCDVTGKLDEATYEVRLYMNIADFGAYQNCENTYHGRLRHFDAISELVLENRDTGMDPYTLCINAPYLDGPVKWGLDFGVSSRPLMPTSAKVLVAKARQEETPAFLASLKISREDIRRLRQYNMLSIL